MIEGFDARTLRELFACVIRVGMSEGIGGARRPGLDGAAATSIRTSERVTTTFLGRQSERITVIGLTRTARSAGTSAPANDTSRQIPTVAANVPGSVG